MRRINSNIITEEVKRLCIEGNTILGDDVIKSFEKTKYGIEIVKTEYRPDCTKVENKSIKYVTNDEIEANEILNIFKENQVTPINSEEVIMDLFRKKF